MLRSNEMTTQRSLCQMTHGRRHHNYVRSEKRKEIFIPCRMFCVPSIEHWISMISAIHPLDRMVITSHHTPCHTKLHHTIPYQSTLHHTLHHTKPHHTEPKRTTPHQTTSHDTIPQHTTPHTTPHHTKPHHTEPNRSAPHHTIHHTTPYHTKSHHIPHHTTLHERTCQNK